MIHPDVLENDRATHPARRSGPAAAPVSKRSMEHARETAAPGRTGTIPAKSGRIGVSDRLARSEARLLALAVFSMSVVCALVVVYLAAYARVASLGLQQSSARVELRLKQQQQEKLRADCAVAASPALIAQQAQQMGLVLTGTPVAYVMPQASQPASLAAGAIVLPVNQAGSLSTSGQPAASAIVGSNQTTNQEGDLGSRMASRGTITDSTTQASPGTD